MARILFLIVLCSIATCLGDMMVGGPNGTVCRKSDPAQGGCLIDGTGCDGEHVNFFAYNLTLDRWNQTTKKYTTVGKIESHALAGKKDTWQMYLHGPRLRETEAAEGDFVPPFYVQATFTNMVYKFENVTKDNGIVTATQKMVGNALAPSTSYPIEDANTGKVKGLLVAEGNPFWINNPFTPKHMQMYKGGVTYLDKDNCTLIFPQSPPFPEKVHQNGQVVNTVDCHRELGVCLFSVWKFYDDQYPIWSNKSAPDCLYFCILQEGGLKDGIPHCTGAGVLLDDDNNPVCHVDGLGAVHGFTVGNTVEMKDKDNGSFDTFLMYTGGATFDGGSSLLRKLTISISTNDGIKSIRTTKAAWFGQELFKDTVPKGHDVGGDHAWVDATGTKVWVSTFRVDNPGVHMLDYETGELLYSIHGMSSVLKGNYAYSAGIHGIGAMGKEGSVIAVATSACTMPHSACFPIPYLPFEPSFLEGIGVMFVLDISKVLDEVQHQVGY